MSDHSSLRSDLGLSGDQFYRRVRALVDAGLISPERGIKNKLILSDTDAAVMRQFRAIEQTNTERGIEWCLERLRYELTEAKAAELAARAEQLEETLTFQRTENRQLRMALAKRTRNPFARFVSWWKRFTAPTQSSES